MCAFNSLAKPGSTAGAGAQRGIGFTSCLRSETHNRWVGLADSTACLWIAQDEKGWLQAGLVCVAGCLWQGRENVATLTGTDTNTSLVCLGGPIMGTDCQIR